MPVVVHPATAIAAKDAAAILIANEVMTILLRLPKRVKADCGSHACLRRRERKGAVPLRPVNETRAERLGRDLAFEAEFRHRPLRWRTALPLRPYFWKTAGGAPHWAASAIGQKRDQQTCRSTSMFSSRARTLH